jgi:hypothetical protein
LPFHESLKIAWKMLIKKATSHPRHAFCVTRRRPTCQFYQAQHGGPDSPANFLFHQRYLPVLHDSSRMPRLGAAPPDAGAAAALRGAPARRRVARSSFIAYSKQKKC